VHKEAPLNWNKWMRQTHRWFSILFTTAVIINGIAVAKGKYNNWLGLMALLPLALLLLTGLYLFVLPYTSKWRRARRTG
jgi:heme A synthase